MVEVLRIKIWKDRGGQDLIEYALIAGFIAVAGGAIMPGGERSIGIVFQNVAAIIIQAT